MDVVSVLLPERKTTSAATKLCASAQVPTVCIMSEWNQSGYNRCKYVEVRGQLYAPR